MKVKMTTAVNRHKAGSVVDVTPAAARTLVSNGAAEAIEEEPKRTPRKRSTTRPEPSAE